MVSQSILSGTEIWLPRGDGLYPSSLVTQSPRRLIGISSQNKLWRPLSSLLMKLKLKQPNSHNEEREELKSEKILERLITPPGLLTWNVNGAHLGPQYSHFFHFVLDIPERRPLVLFGARVYFTLEISTSNPA